MRLVATRWCTRLLWFVASILTMTGLCTPSWAFEPPAFDPEKSLHETGLERNDAHAVRRVLSGRGLRVWVVVADVIDDHVHDEQAATHTEDALEQTWSAWTAQGFEGASECLMVVGVDDRRVQLKCGSALDRDLGLHTDRLSNITDRAFVPAARRGDLGDGIRNTVQLLRERHDAISGVAPYVWDTDTDRRHLVQSVDGIWTPRSAISLLDSNMSLDTYIVAVVRGGPAQTLAEQVLAGYRAASHEHADKLAVITYVWATDEFGVAVAPEASRWTDSADRSVLAALHISRGVGSFEDRLAEMSAVLDRPFSRGIREDREQHLRPPQLGPLKPQRHLYGPLDLMDQPDLEAWLASLPMAVRLHLVPALHDGELTTNPSGTSWTEHIVPSAEALAETSRSMDPTAPRDVVLTVWAAYDDQPMHLRVDVPPGLGGWYSTQYTLQTEIDGAWVAPPKGPDRWTQPELQQALSAAIQPMLDAHQEYETQLQRQTDRRRRGTAIATFVMSIIFGCVLLFTIWVATAPSRKRRRSLLAEVQEWRVRIAVARERMTDFVIDTELRERLLDLKVRGPASRALLHRVTSELDQVELGLRGLQAHVDAIGSSVEGRAIGLSSAGYTDSMEQLHRAFETPPSSADDPGLFGPAQTATLRATEFVDSLQERFAAARADWQRLLHAVDLAWRDDLPAHVDPVHVDGVIRQLEQEHMGNAWLVGHPINRPAELRSLRSRRREDPVAYLDATEQITADGAAVFARIDAVLDDIVSVRVAAERAQTQLRDMPAAVLSDAQDPHIPAARAREAAEHLTRLTVLPDNGVTVELAQAREVQIDELALTALTGWTEALRRLADLHASVRACGEIAQVQAQLRDQQQRVAPMKARLANLAVSHKMRPVWDQVMGLFTELSDVQLALDATARDIEALRWVDAAQWLERARAELTEATRAKDRVEQMIDDLRQAKDAAHAIRQQLANERAVRAERLQALGEPSDTSLRPGDALLAGLQSSWGDGPADWAERLSQVQAVQQSWKDAVNHRQHEVDEAYRRVLQSELEAQLRREQQERSDSFGQSSWTSRSSSWTNTATSSTPSSIDWPSSSSSSSHRSTGRSGGSSFGPSSGRSGGSSW